MLLSAYPSNTPVLVEVFDPAGGLKASASGTTDGDGLLEVNHTGVDDCWDPPLLDIQPGDKVQTTYDLGGAVDVDFTVARDIAVAADAAGVPLQPTIARITGTNDSLLTIMGSGTSAPGREIVPETDALELRLNKRSANPWGDNNNPSGRRDLREDVALDLTEGSTFTFDESTGQFSFVHRFRVSNEDAQDVERNGVDVVLEWSGAVLGEAEVLPEITVFDANEGPPLCADPDGGGSGGIGADTLSIERVEQRLRKRELRVTGSIALRPGETGGLSPAVDIFADDAIDGACGTGALLGTAAVEAISATSGAFDFRQKGDGPSSALAFVCAISAGGGIGEASVQVR